MIVDAVLSALPELQQQAESMMTTPCRIVRLGEPVLDQETGNFTPSETTVYEGGCKIQTREGQVQSDQPGSSSVISQLYQVQVPVSAGPFQDKDVVIVPGRTFLIDGLHTKTWQTAQRLPVVEVI